MASSGTYSFFPTLAELTTNALGRCKIRRPEITAALLVEVRMEMNLLLQEWGNKGVNLWKVELSEIPLVAGQGEYTLSSENVQLLEAYISTGSPPTDRIMMGISRSDWAAYPNKEQQGFPTVFWFNRLIVPKLHLWQVPDDTQEYTLKYYWMRQIQDASPTGTQTPEIPQRFLNAFASGLAYRLARIYASSDIEAMRLVDYERDWKLAAEADIEDTPISIQPGVSAYYRAN